MLGCVGEMVWNNMEDLNSLFNDIRAWNREWSLFDYYRLSPLKELRDNRPDMPKTSDDFILELNEKYSVNLKQ